MLSKRDFEVYRTLERRWKDQSEIEVEVVHDRGSKLSEEANNPLEKAYFGILNLGIHRGVQNSLQKLIDVGYVETKVIPPSDTEINEYVEEQVPPHDSCWQGTRLYRRSSTMLTYIADEKNSKEMKLSPAYRSTNKLVR